MTQPFFLVDSLTYLSNGPYSFQLQEGDVLGLSGPSGVGKTQMLKALVEMIPYAGQLFLAGVPIQQFSAPEWRKSVGLVAAESAWWFETPEPHFPEDYSRDLLMNILADLGFEPDVMGWSISRLSTGERQRLALARTLILQPKVLLLDEPCSALDPDTTIRVEKLLGDYVSNPKRAAIWISHDYDQLKRVANYCYKVMPDRLESLWS